MDEETKNQFTHVWYTMMVVGVSIVALAIASFGG